jgi:hypothetical protein
MKQTRLCWFSPLNFAFIRPLIALYFHFRGGDSGVLIQWRQRHQQNQTPVLPTTRLPHPRQRTKFPDTRGIPNRLWVGRTFASSDRQQGLNTLRPIHLRFLVVAASFCPDMEEKADGGVLAIAPPAETGSGELHSVHGWREHFHLGNPFKNFRLVVDHRPSSFAPSGYWSNKGISTRRCKPED